MIFSVLRSFVRCTRASASIECALGGFVLLMVVAVAFDLYSRVRADTASAPGVVTMADYVAQTPDPVASDLSIVGELISAHFVRVPSDLVAVISLYRRSAGDPDAQLVWMSDGVRIGDPAGTASLALRCARFGSSQVDMRHFLPADGTHAVVVELCVKLRREGSVTGRFVGSDIYRVHVTAVRDPSKVPAAPTT